MGGEHIFDLEGRNILSVADDRIPATTGNADVAVCIDPPEIAVLSQPSSSNASASSAASA
jgi:hypothetical protein